MTHFLPPAIMNLFPPPPPLEYKAPVEKSQLPALSGIAQFVERFKNDIPIPKINKTHQEVKDQRASKKQQTHQAKLQRWIHRWDPKSRSEVTGDAYKTLFVARLSHDVTEENLKHEFEYYGPIVHVKLIKTTKGKSRGYAFVEFENARDLTEAYKDADGRKINGRRILVDVERGRTVKNWIPRKYGGGLGGTRLGGNDVNQRTSGREPPAGSAAPAPRRDRSPVDRRPRDGGRDNRDDRERDRPERPRIGGRDERRDDRGGDRRRRRSRSRSRSRSPKRRHK